MQPPQYAEPRQSGWIRTLPRKRARFRLTDTELGAKVVGNNEGDKGSEDHEQLHCNCAGAGRYVWLSIWLSGAGSGFSAGILNHPRLVSFIKVRGPQPWQP